jgi:hypothetical protein
MFHLELGNGVSRIDVPGGDSGLRCGQCSHGVPFPFL